MNQILKWGGENLVTFKLKLAYIHPFTFPVCDKDENQEIEPGLRKRNPLSYYQQMENIQRALHSNEGSRALR